jgi:hypothetical protein
MRYYLILLFSGKCGFEQKVKLTTMHWVGLNGKMHKRQLQDRTCFEHAVLHHKLILRY